MERTSMQHNVGRVVAGKYELVELVGEGGMATVWRARMYGAAGFSRPVAVKKMKAEFRAIKNYIDMFVEEARVGSELQHPNIVQVYDLCQDEERSYYLVMEWVDGMDLGSFVRAFTSQGHPTPWPLVAAVGVGALRGLAAAHERKGPAGEPAPVIHRDVSPHNVLLGRNGVVKLTDFGLARAMDRIHSLTAPGTVKGKLSYLAPEITMGKGATPLSDVFSMGSTLWEGLAGEALFDGVRDVDVFAKIRRGEVRPIDSMRADLPPRLVAALHRALAIAPAQRFASARDMAHEISGVLATVQSPTDAQTLLGRAVEQARAWRGGRGHHGSEQREVHSMKGPTEA
jgi:serine/threonine-protein kinase